MNAAPRTGAPGGAPRIEVLDIIRGVTVGGILPANILWFSGYFEIALADRGSMLASEVDHALVFLIRVLVHGKFYHVFAFLFGVGFALYALRSSPGNGDLLPRRLALLFLFGAAHSLLWWGDILRYYALIGFSLLLFRHLGNRQIVCWIVFCSLMPAVLAHARALWPGSLPDLGFVDIPRRDWLEHVTHATQAQRFELNLRQAGDHLLQNVGDGRLFKILAMFLAGLLAERSGLFAQPEKYAALIRRVIVPSFVVGIAANLARASLYYGDWGLRPAAAEVLREWIGVISVPTLALCYVSLLLHLALPSRRQTPAARILHWMAPVGRMALTNYIMQTLLAIAVFHPALGGQYASLSIRACVVLVLLIFGLQVLYSHWWLARFRYGPLEWLWRSGTRWQWQRLRR